MTRFKFLLLMLKRQVAFVLIGLMLSGCATMYYIRPPGVDVEQGERDRAACIAESLKAAGPYYQSGDGWMAVAIKNEVMDACMRAKGYVKGPKP